ncbi:MAG: LysR family transcriptional regulator [Rhodoplanes sp.]
MEMHQVRYFLAVAEQLNFTKAAESCNVSQPSLTRAIKLLEEEFGGLLFHRERANTHLTDLGRTVRPHLQQIYDEAHAAKRLAQDLAKLRRVTLKLGIMCTVAPTQLIDLLTSVQTRYDHIEIELTDASARELETMLLDGNLEVAILCRPDRELDERIHTMPLFREQMMVVVPPNHLLATKDAIRVKDLHGMNYVNRAKCEFNGYAGQFFREQGVECRTVYRSERDDWVLAMIRSGLGSASCRNSRSPIPRSSQGRLSSRTSGAPSISAPCAAGPIRRRLARSCGRSCGLTGTGCRRWR